MNIELTSLKQELIEVATATAIGFNCTPATKEHIESLANKIEALTPTPAPTDSMELAQGRWRLLYSTLALDPETTIQRLSFGKLPDVKVKIAEIFQEINISDREYNNLIVFAVGSGVKGIAAVKACYSIENDKRLNIEFIQTSAYPVEKGLEVSEFRKALAVDNDSVLESPLELSGWVDITYLDENFLLMRGNAQNLYVLVRDDSIPLG